VHNVVLLTIDTLRQDAVGCYRRDGHEEDKSLTPFIDSVAAEAMRFANMQAVGPYTQASFPGILTSSYYLDWGRQKKCPKERTLISEVALRAGLTTAGIHSNPYISEFFGWKRGWDYFYDSMEEEVTDEVPYVTGDVINRKVARWLEGHTAGGSPSPFFLWVHYMDVHEPYVPTEDYLARVDPTLSLSRAEMMTLFRDVLLARKVDDRDKVAQLRALYRAKVGQVDDFTKELVHLLQEAGVWDTTSFILTSDHGDEFAEHGGLSHDGKFFRELITVPCLIRVAPEEVQEEMTEGGADVSDTVVSNLDLPPTLCRLAGIPIPDAFQGRSLLPLNRYETGPCFGEAMDKVGAHEGREDHPTYYCQQGPCKVIYREREDRWEGYQLAEDPAEQEPRGMESPEFEALQALLLPRLRRWEKR